jgi:hypothetical protein
MGYHLARCGEGLLLGDGNVFGATFITDSDIMVELLSVELSENNARLLAVFESPARLIGVE